MAKIPSGENFGYRTPQSPAQSPMPRLDTQVADATSRLGQTAVGVGAQLIQDGREEAERAIQVKTMTAHANIQNGLADLHDAVTADLLEGKTDKRAATAAWKDGAQKIVTDNLEAVPVSRKEAVAAGVKGLEGQLQNKLFDTFRKRDQEDVAAGLVTYREQMTRFASTDPAAAIQQWGVYVDKMGPAAGLRPEQLAKMKQGVVEEVSYNQFRRAGQVAMQSGDPAAIDEVQKRLNGPDGEVLDPAKRNTLDQTLYGWRQSIEARQAREADKQDREATKRFNTATDTVNKARDLALSGAFLAPDFIATMVEQAAGTGLEPDVKALLESQKQVAGFASASAPQRAALLEAARARRGDPAIGTDPRGQKQLNAAVQIDAKLRQRVEDGEAWAAAQSVGVIRDAGQFNIANPAGVLQVFQQRMANIGDVEAWAGKKISPLQPQEAEQATRMLKALKPDAASSLLSQIGQTIGDPERIAAVAKQIGDKDGTLGLAMAFSNAKTTEGRYTSELILDGAQRIKDKAIKPDGMAESGWRAAIAKEVRGAYSNQEVESNIIQAAFLISASTDGDVARSVRLATGGGVIERNGGRIPLPAGVPEREFGKRIEAVTPAVLADQAPGGFVLAGPARVPLADFVKSLPDARLVHAGQGLYNVRAGNTLVTNEQGRRITIKVTP